MTDLHTHILPCIDDGAQSLEEAVNLLLAEERQWVTNIVFTPHFILQDKTVAEFLESRNKSFNILKTHLTETGLCNNMNFYLGAEVRFDPNIVNEDLYSLCIEGTSYLLLEPLNFFPFKFEQTLDTLLARGITPILAHVERFSYLIKDKALLNRLAENGVLFQCNASALLAKNYAKDVKKLLKKGFVHVLASDTHNLENRPPELGLAYNMVSKHSELLKRNANRIIQDKLI